MKAEKLFLSFYFIFFSGQTFANGVRTFTATHPSEAEGEMFYHRNFPDYERIRNSARARCLDYSTKNAGNEAETKCARQIQNLQACKNAQKTSRVVEFTSPSDTIARCNVEVTITIQYGWH